MKKILIIALFCLCYSILPAQISGNIADINSGPEDYGLTIPITTANSWDGAYINPTGQKRMLNILINIIYDETPLADPYPTGGDWPEALTPGINNTQPTWLLDLFDTEIYQSNDIHGTYTRKYYESSFGNLHLIGDFVIINVLQSYITYEDLMEYNQFDVYTLIDRSIEYLNFCNDTGGLQTKFGHNQVIDYDADEDGDLDFGSILIRNSGTRKITINGSEITLEYGQFNTDNGTVSGSNIPINFLKNGVLIPLNSFLGPVVCIGNSHGLVDYPTSVLYHETGHCLIGGNNMHSGGGNGWTQNSGRAFLQQMGGYGIMGQSSSGLVSVNGFDRWWLHWKSPVYNTSNSYIAASNQPSDITMEDGTKTYILRDFVTTGDAIRIKLPYVDNGAKNQYIWLENHKIGSNNKLDFLSFSNTHPCRPAGKPGIYAFYQVGKDVLTGESTFIRPPGQSDHIKLISAEGNFNYEKLPDTLANCIAGDYPQRGRKTDPNPFMGNHDAMAQFSGNTPELLTLDNAYGLYVKNHYVNGQWINNDSVPFLMDDRDAFRGTREFNLSSNPAPVNTTTYYNSVDSEKNIEISTLTGLVNSDSIYLTGLDIYMVALANGDYKVTIGWGHNRLDNSVAWTGKIALKESLYVNDDDTLLLKQNNTICQINRDPVTGLFAPYTTFDCRENSEMYLSSNSRTILSEKSKFYIQSGSVVTIQNNAKVIVKSGCELIIEDCGNLVIRESGQLVVEAGGILTIKSGANVFMDGQNNLDLQPGFEIGVGGIPLTGDIVLNLKLLGVPPLKQITTNTTWQGGTYKFFDDLYISSGATLNLAGTTLQFFKHAKVKVARGAKLNMAGNSKLTTTCTNELWRGVEVWGNPSLSQTPTTNQGHVVMNNSTIEFARTGVLLDKTMPTDGPGVPSGNGGGIIQAYSSTFSNNYIGVGFSGYTTYDNISTFSNCLFTANETFPEIQTGIDCHASLNAVIGIDFKKCTFNTESLNSDLSKNIVGIRSYNSNFLADGIIDPVTRLYQRSVFENLKYGVYATASLSSRNFAVRNSVFRNNNTGVFASGVNNARITENLIIQPIKLDDNKFTMFGIYLEYCDKYTIQQDSLWGLDFWQGENKDRSEAGILIKNSGPAENLVYNNLILGFQGGVISEGENRGLLGTGLCVKCNVFVNNSTDIQAIPSAGIPVLNQGIRNNQGSNAPEITSPGGNIFTNKLYNPLSININNEFAQPINYFYHTNANGFNLIPPANGVIIDFVTVFRNGGSNIPFYRNDACPSKLDLNDSKDVLIAKTDSLNSVITVKENELSSLIDDNDTPLMLNNVVSSAPFDALWLHDELLSTSPYLSDTILIEAGKKEDVLNSAMIRDIMVANPHSAKSSEVMSILEQRVESIPDELMAEIEAGKNLIGAKQALEISISDISFDLAFSKSRLLDSFYEENDYDSIRWVLQQFPEPMSEYQQAWTWFDESDTGNGLTAVQNINLLALPEHFRDNQTGYLEIAGILNHLANDTTYVLVSDSIVVEALFTLANFDIASGVSARNLLSSYRLLEFDPTVSLPDTALKTSRLATDSKSKSKTEKEGLYVFPNPANDFIIIDYALEMDGELRLITQEGRVVYSRNINADKNQILIRLNNFSPGFYIASLTQGRKVLNAKFTVK